MPSKSNKIFEQCVVSIAGDLDDNSWREEKVKQWVQYWGGAFTPTIDAGVTHLLCTKENFEKKIAPVREALRSKVTKIVLRDWLEDSISKKMCLRTLPYQLDTKAKKEAAEKRKLKRIEQMSGNAEKYVDERFWHIYRDSTDFEYQVQLTRINEETGNIGERHLLTLWESDAKPYNYMSTTLYTKSKRKGSRCALQDSPVNLDAALGRFKSFFKKKANISWDDRIKKRGMAGPEHFHYQPPSGGKPIGLINERNASILGEDGDDSHLAPSDQAIEEAHNCIADTAHRKHYRDESTTEDATMNAADGERSAKRSKHGREDIPHEHHETKSDAAEQAIFISSDSESEEGTQNGQGHHELSSDEPTQDASGLHEFELESSNATKDGTFEPYEDYDGRHGSSDEYDTANDDVLLAPYSSEAEGEQNGSESEVAHDEVQYPGVVDDYYGYDVDHGASADHGTSPEDSAAHAAAENIYYQSMRGVRPVNDSQVDLIDSAYARAETVRELRERERVEGDENYYG
ncbi:hypothetical protein F5X98DRAFT_386950 [Xylaria grammica]|nr:hypothetical protein F5X98DRAFT_386950 [Xylaria grammica]